MDTLAIFHRADHYSVAFCVDGRWWPVIRKRDQGQTRRFPSERAARCFLGRAFDGYRAAYDERLPWDMDAIRVVELTD